MNLSSKIGGAGVGMANEIIEQCIEWQIRRRGKDEILLRKENGRHVIDMNMGGPGARSFFACHRSQ